MNLVLINVEKMAEILNVKSAVIYMLNKITNISLLLKKKKKKEEDGKENIVKELMLTMRKNVENGITEIWNMLENCLWKQQKDIYLQKKEEEKEIKELMNGKRKILKKEELKKNYNIGLKPGKLLDHCIVLNVNLNVKFKLIMKIIQNLWMLFGSAKDVIFFYIMNINITVRDLTKRLRKEMRKSQLPTKAEEENPKWFSRYRKIVSKPKWLKVRDLWQAGGKARFIYLPPGYNNDPYSIECQQYADVKSTLMDLKLLPRKGEDNKAQATYECAA